MRTRVTVTVAVATLVTLGACGGSSPHAAKSTTTTAPVSTTTTFVGPDGSHYAYPPDFTPTAANCAGAPFGEPWSSLRSDEKVACSFWWDNTPEGRAANAQR